MGQHKSSGIDYLQFTGQGVQQRMNFPFGFSAALTANKEELAAKDFVDEVVVICRRNTHGFEVGDSHSD